ncbi:hypothetical protein ABFW14_13655 [Mycolicibacterium fortuitum]|uniref:hypothetical protein n=1 Tax=Mycolicibacterium TaxID=1866885 RepID=UPI000A8E3E4F|nr:MULTISPECIES: hypothetical protein [Mycolicibacterium]
MQLALRPYVTAGVAIVGAGIIAATPITAAAPEIQNRAVTLSAAVQTLDLPSPADASPFVAAPAESSFVDPIARWAEVFELTSTNLTKLFQNALADPAPVLRQIIANQTGYAELVGESLSTTVQNLINAATIYIPEYLEEARLKFEAGDIMGVGNVMSRATLTIASTLFPMLNLLSIPDQMVGNLSSVLEELTFKSFIDVGLLGQVGMGFVTVVQGYVQFGAARIGQDLYDAVKTGDMVKLVSTIINAPADTVSSILNGSYVPPRRPGAPGTWTSGLFSPDRTYAPLRSFLVDIPKAIAAAITPQAAPATARLVAGTTSETTGSEVAGVDNALAATGLTEKLKPQPATADAAATSPAETPSETTTPVSSDTETAPAAEESASPAVTSEKPSTKPTSRLVRDSIVAVPGKTTVEGAAGGKVLKPGKVVSEKVSATVEGIGQKIKKAFDKPAKKAASADKAAGSKTAKSAKSESQ